MRIQTNNIHEISNAVQGTRNPKLSNFSKSENKSYNLIKCSPKDLNN